jgi:hypothetical protein
MSIVFIRTYHIKDEAGLDNYFKRTCRELGLTGAFYTFSLDTPYIEHRGLRPVSTVTLKLYVMENAEPTAVDKLKNAVILFMKPSEIIDPEHPVNRR